MSPFVTKQNGGNQALLPENDHNNRERKELSIAFEQERSISEVSQEHEDESKSLNQTHRSRSSDSEYSELVSERLPKKRLKQSPPSGRNKNSRQNRHPGTKSDQNHRTKSEKKSND